MRTTNVSYKNKKQVTIPDDQRITIYNTHTPIISQELWDKCREMEKSVSTGKSTKTGVVLPLSGLMYCEDCGNKMYIGHNNTRHSRKGPRTYFRQNYNCGDFYSHFIKNSDIQAIEIINKIFE